MVSDRRCARIKICGLTRPADAIAAIAAGADYVGLNFHPLSPRCVAEDRASEILTTIGDQVRGVGVFVDQSADEIRAIAARLGLRCIQLHGERPCADRAAFAGFELIHAFRIGSAADVAAMARVVGEWDEVSAGVDAILVDARVEGQAGGTGRTIPDDVIGGLGEWLSAAGERVRLVLAGGLTPENVAARIGRLRPWMVDVASGVETSPGVKDPAKMSSFCAAVREVAP
jgi:phosphoribosylanthranilate isomerase